MVSKNNRQKKMEAAAERKPHFAIRKLTIGAASVLLGTSLWMSTTTSAVHADEAKNDDGQPKTDLESSEAATSGHVEKVVVEQNQSSNDSAEESAKSNGETTQNNQESANESNDVTSENAQQNKATTSEEQKSAAAVTADNSQKVAENKAETKSAEKTTEVKQNAKKTSANTTTAKKSSEKATTDTTKKVEQNANSVAKNANVNNSALANNQTDLTKSNVQLNENLPSVEQAGQAGKSTVKADNKTTQELKIGDLSSDLSGDALKADLGERSELLVSHAGLTGRVEAGKNADPTKQLAALKASLVATNTNAADNYTTVTDFSGLQNAVSTGAQGVNISGNITAYGDLNINGNFTIKGADKSATLNLGSNKINNNGTLNLEDITVNGSVMGNGTVNVKGTVTSNVDDVNGYNLTNSEQSSRGVKVNWNQTKGNNIQARAVNVEEGASLTVNRASIGDGIHLVESGSAVNVADNANLTINMNTTNGTQTARYHDAGIFSESNSSFTTGRNSVVTFNTSIGQAISMAGMRPNVSDSERFGGYHARSRENGSGQINLGQYSTMNFTGRDGVILGNNSNFNVGEYANVHFENKGRGVALDLANQSNINIGDHAVTYFHSVGKTGTSGSYDGYNYIGVNEGGNITVGEGATFRVILEGRGSDPWDDVVSLDSQNANTNAAFTSKPGAIVDIRDDNTDFYAELISFPLGASHSRIDIDDPLMLNLQRYSHGGATTGWMATGGDMINTTSSKYTANLIYMSGANGVFSVEGGDYDPSNPDSSGFVVYQQIKSDGSKQIWLNVNDVNIPMNGFQTKNIWNNNANPDISISGNGLTGGIRANQVHNYDGTPLTGKDAPYYGISTQRASHQIWIPHRTPLEVTGHHTNTIKYVDETGKEIFPESTSSLNLKRNLVLDITKDQIKKIQDYALSHTADETLEYIKNSQSVAQDSGWKFTNAAGQTVTDPYATVESPKLDGYTATIQSTNVQGLKVGEDGSSVTAKFAVNPSEDIVQNGELSDSYKKDGITGIPNDYVTVVVYKKAAEKGSVKVVYHDDTTNTEIPNTEYNTGSVDAGTKVDYTTDNTIKNLEDKGYVYVTTDGTIPPEIQGNTNVTVTVHMRHGVVPVDPNTPGQDIPKKPDGTPAVDPNTLKKTVDLTVTYKNSDGTTFTGKIPDNANQSLEFDGTVYIDKTNGQQVNAKQENGQWVVDTDNTATPTTTWVLKGTSSDSGSFDAVTSPAEAGYHVKDNGVDPAQYADGINVGKISNITHASDSIKVTVTYDKDIAKQGAINVSFYDTTDKVDIPGYGNQSGQEDVGTKYTYNPQDDIKALEDKGYVVDGTVPTIPSEITEGTQNIVINMKHGNKPVNPNNPDSSVDPSEYTKDVKETVHYVVSDGKVAAPADKVQTSKWTRTLTIDTVTHKLVPNGQYDTDWSIPDGEKKTYDQVNTPVLTGYYADQANVPATAVTQDDIERTVTYKPIGTIIPVDTNGDPIPDQDHPQFKNDPNDPTKVVPGTKPSIPGYHPTDGKPGDPVDPVPGNPGEDVKVPYAKDGSDIENAKNLPTTQTVRYVDDEGNVLSPEKKQSSAFIYSGDTVNTTTHEVTKQGSWNQTSYNFTAENVPVINGYVAVSGYTNNDGKYTAGGYTSVNTGSDAERNRVFTVVYKKLGKIIPVDDGGNKIPNAPTPEYKNDPIDPTKVVPNEPVPSVPGYTPSVPTVTPTDPTQDTPVVYNKDVEDQTVTVKYIDDATGDAHTDLSSYDKSITAKPGAALNYSTAGTIAELENKGYVLVSDDFNVTTMPEKGGSYEVHLNHRTTTIDPQNPGHPGEPINPNDPNGPKWPEGTDAKTLTKDGSQTIHYVYTDGTKAAEDNVQNTSFDHTLVFDNVTGKQIQDKGWAPESHKFNDVKSPDIVGYHTDQITVAGTTVTPDDPTKTITVVYAKNGTHVENKQEVNASQIVNYVDDQGNKVSESKSQDFTFTYTGDTVDDVTKQVVSQGKWLVNGHSFTAEDVPVVNGYVAVSGYTNNNGKYTAGGFTTTYDETDAQRNRVFTVVYKKIGNIVPVGPDGKTPIPDPTNPGQNVPNKPYVNDPNDPTKVNPNEPVPDVPGYTPSTPSVTPTDPTKDTPVIYTPDVKDQTVTVKYYDDTKETDLSSYDKSITAKPGEALNYSTQGSIAELENKGYKLVSDNFNVTTMPENGGSYEVHFVHNTTTINPENPGHPGEPINPNDPNGPKWPEGTNAKALTKDGSQTVHYVYSDGTKAADDNVQNTTFEHTLVFDNVTGKQVEDRGWTPESHKFNNVTSPTINGYTPDKTTVDGATVTTDNPTVETTVTYTKNGQETRGQRDVTASQIVKYVDDQGHELQPSKDQSSIFHYSGDTYDKVTGAKISTGTWNENSASFTAENVPVIDGYVAVSGYTNNDGKYTAGGFTTTYNETDAQRNRVFTVVYKKIGKIVPVDPSGKQIPNTPTPEYKNDPQDPTKVTPNEPVPNVPGYTPSVPTVTPTDPTKDTPVVYNQVKDQNAVVNYVDADENNKIITTSGDLSGKAGEKIDYSTATTIQDLENKGYVLVNDGFPKDATYDNDDNTTQTYTVVLRHGTQPVNPDNPGKPGEPINPNDPNGPKYPQDSNQVTKTVTRTIQYVDENGNQVSTSVTQPVKFTAQGVLDKVTGKWITPLTWSSDQTVSEVRSPIVSGYHLVSVDRDQDGNNVKGVTLTHDDSDYTVTVQYAKNGKIIPVDPKGNPIPNAPQPQYPNDPSDPAKVTPNEPVPNIPGYTPSVPTVTPTDPGKDTPVIYTPVTPAKDQVAVVNYVDADEDNKLITSSGDLTGKAGETIDYSTATTIKDLENKGYVLVNDGFPAGAKFDSDDNTTQIYTVVLKHGTTTITPDKPGKPGEPINPNDPNGPKWPDNTGENNLSKTGTQTIHYTGAGDKTPADNKQEFTFTKTMVVDNVTGNIITNGSWNVTSHTFGNVDTPVVDGYHADKRTAGGTTITPDDLNKTVTVNYSPNGHIIPVDPSGKPIPNVPTPQYPTDPSDPTKVTPDEPVPTIPGYTPSVPTVTPTDPGKDTPVPYNPVVPAKDQAAVVNYVDSDEDNKIITSSPTLTGKAGETIDYSTAATIKDLENKGYVLVNDGFPAGAKFDNDDNTTQVYTVVLKHGTTTITPDKPGKPGEPINPNDPNGPKWPDNTGENNLRKTGTQTIHYTGAGDKTPEDNKQSFDFTKTMVVDNVTGKIITNGSWNVTSHTFGSVDTPVVDGYHADKRTAGNTTVTPDDLNKTVTVTYSPNGKIVPVDPSGKPIPNVPTPQYPTDPSDPTKVTPDEPVPTIPGYTPSTPTVTPTDPGKDTPVPYTPVTPAKDQVAVVNYVDADEGNKIITSSGDISGKAGEKIDYSTTATITDLENKGYVLVNDGFPKDATFDNDDNTTQTYTVVFKHGTVPVTPTNPGKPGEPINPNDPNGPKWPDGTGETSLDKNVTRTITFVDSNGKEVASPVDQTIHFTATGVIDKVTGKWVTPLTWSPDQSIDGRNVPVVDGYHVVSIDKDGDGLTKIKGVTLTHNDSSYKVTVTYAQNGKIIPVDPNGKPIPNAPTPQYPTDPKDPSKVVPNEPVPNVPGYTPSVPNVTPTDPGKDTPVPYKPVEAKRGSVQVIFHDDTTNSTIPDVGYNSGSQKAGTKVDYTTTQTIQDLENKGYVYVSTDGTIPAEITADKNITVTVHMKHGTTTVTPDKPGKPGEPINPNDPNGPKWPDTTGKDNLSKTGTQTIHYTGAGTNTPKDNVQSFTFTRTAVVDNVTGKVISTGSWNVTSHTFGSVNTPVVDGYHADKRTAGNTTITPEDLTKTVTVNYTANGKIIPVDPNGKPIPNAPTPQYHTDPNDPTKVVPNEPVPNVPGYTPSVPSVTPSDPGKDTPVPYTPQTTPVTPVTPDQPTTPTNPTTPDTPSPAPHGEDVPATPDTPAPAPHDEKKPEAPSTPAPKPHATKETTKGNAPAKENKTVPTSAPVAKEEQAPKAELPQTGEKDNTAATILGATAGMIGLIGLSGVKKKKHGKEEKD